MICPLCRASETAQFYRDRRRSYYQCCICSLVFVPKEFFPDPEEEKGRYKEHNNYPDDPRYRAFLNGLFLPMKDRIRPAARGLDYGSGPVPVLSVMFREAGYDMTLYDCFFHPDGSFSRSTYDFITVCETAEHFHNPAEEWARIWPLLNEAGWLGIMTDRRFDKESFGRWYYKNDFTHVCFYKDETFRWLGQKWDSLPVFLSGNTVLFRKSPENLTEVDQQATVQ